MLPGDDKSERLQCYWPWVQPTDKVKIGMKIELSDV